jgi:alginate O-acetyltransferase complex protein AlgI
MIFASPIFLFFFLPLVLLAYYAFPRAARNAVLLLASYAFYAWWRVDFAVLMVASSLVDYFAGLAMSRAGATAVQRKIALLASLCCNLGLLGFFKYANFGIDTLNALLAAGGHGQIEWTRVLLPVGISFYTFQTMSYSIDVYRRRVEPTRDLLTFGTYVSLFPQLVAGPIVRYSEIAGELKSRVHSFERFAQGCLLFALGFEKKILIADSVAPLADAAFALPDPSLVEAWWGVGAYTLQLYFDFSGYSDMAIGLGLMFGFRFPINFDSPYKSESITEFWRRWHVSLSAWLRDYLYIPLGGNQISERRTYVNLCVTMLLGGMWHGANWTFIAWGAWHGGLLAFERAIGKRPLYSALPRPLRIALTMALVMFGWTLFRALSLSHGFEMWGAMIGLGRSGGDLRVAPDDFQLGMLALGTALAFFAKPSQAIAETPGPRWAIIALLFPLAVMQLLFASYSPFLYFQF